MFLRDYKQEHISAVLDGYLPYGWLMFLVEFHPMDRVPSLTQAYRKMRSR